MAGCRGKLSENLQSLMGKLEPSLLASLLKHGHP